MMQSLPIILKLPRVIPNDCEESFLIDDARSLSFVSPKVHKRDDNKKSIPLASVTEVSHV